MGSSGMASSPGVWTEGERGGAGKAGAHGKITKGRGRMVVKPILKKLSNSEKNSLDLDRGWEDQMHNWSGSASATPSPAGAVSRSIRDVAFVPSGFPDLSTAGGGVPAAATSAGAPGGDCSSSITRPKFQHARSPSGASHNSVATTGSNGPGTRSGSFVHPFQQTPRTATPPLSFATSLDAVGPIVNTGGPRDYSPTITENEDDDELDGYSISLRSPPSVSHLAHSRSHSLSGAGGGSSPYPHQPYSLSQSSLRRPSLASQRTSSFSEVTGSSGSNLPSTQPVTSSSGGRLNSNRSAGAASASRLVHGGSMLSSSKSQSDLHLNLTLNTSAAAASATTADGARSSSRSHFQHSPHMQSGRTNSMQSSSAVTMPSASSFGLSSPTSSFSAAPMSPLRSSLEIVTGGLAPRLRSLSEQPDRTKTMDPVEHARLMREARAKFDERERQKNERERQRNEKLAKKRGRVMSKDADKHQRDLEKNQRQARSLASNGSVDHLPRPSTAASTSHYSLGGGSDWWRGYGGPGSIAAPAGYAGDSAAQPQQNEKSAFASESDGDGGVQRVGSSQAQQAQRHRGSSSAKRRTHGYWTSVILWIRTKIFKLSRAE